MKFKDLLNVSELNQWYTVHYDGEIKDGIVEQYMESDIREYNVISIYTLYSPIGLSSLHVELEIKNDLRFNDIL